MEPGRESQTAVMVCMARALADGAEPTVGFSDPTALPLLPDEARRFVERIKAGEAARSLRERAKRIFLEKRAKMMVARTLAIDQAIRTGVGKQLVILGAGLDGRAWRMPELADATVFEVDHPDSQREKRARASALTAVARDIRFVPVDFARDDLEAALISAGHDPASPTTWLWEGVVMYLEQRDIEATLAIVQRRSAPRSRLIVAYISPALMARLVGVLVRRVGEPLRSVFTRDRMRALLARFGFRVTSDQDLPALARWVSAEFARETRVAKHLRIAIADLE